MRRRFICAIVSICIMISLLPGFAGAAETPAFTYTAGDGTVSSCAHLADVFAALNADATATAENPGTILQNADYIINSSTPKLADTAVITEVQKPFVWDLGSHTVTTEPGFTLNASLMKNLTADHAGTIRNGSINVTVSKNLFQIGDTTHAPKSDLTFENVHVYSDGAPFYLSYADGCKLTLDGGSFIAKTSSNSKQTIRMEVGLSQAPTIRLLLKGGVLLEKHGYYGYAVSLRNNSAPQVYILSATFSSYATFIYSSTYLEKTAVLLLAEGFPADVNAAAGQEYRMAFMEFFTKETFPTIYNPKYQSSADSYRYTYKSSDVTMVPITLQDCENGTLSYNHTTGIAGHLLEFDVKPDEGYSFSHLLVNGETWNTNRITVPNAEAITVRAEFVKITDSDEDIRQAILQTALAYHYKGKYVQYDSTAITMQHKNSSGIGRMTSGDSPEMASRDYTVYSVCSDFMYDIYKNVLNYELMGTPRLCRTYVMTQLPKDYPAIVYKYGGDAEKDLNAFYASEKLLQPGDIFVAYKGSAGHAMMYAGDIYGTGTDYIIHCGGRKVDMETGADSVEANGAIWVDKVSQYIYGKTATYNAERYPDETFVILRPLNDPAIHRNLTQAAKARLQYKGIEAERFADVVKYNSLTEEQTVKITTTVTNNGSTAFSGVSVSEPMPVGAKIVDSSISSGGVLSPDGITWAVDVPAGRSVSVSYDAVVTAEQGSSVTFPISSVSTLSTRELTFRVGGEKLTGENLATLNEIAAGNIIFCPDASQTEFASAFYQEYFGVELPLPATISQLQSTLLEKVDVRDITEGNGNQMWRPRNRDSLSEQAQKLYDMVLPEHFTGFSVYLGDDPQAVPFSMAARNRVLNFTEASYEPGDIILGYNKPDMMELTEEKNSFVYIYLGNGLVAAWQDGSEAAIQDFSSSIALCMRASFLLALRPSLVYDDLNSRVSAETYPTLDTACGFDVQFTVTAGGEDLYAVLSKGDDTQTLPQSDWEKTTAGYTVTYTDIAAKELADTVTLQVFDAKGMLLCEETTRVCDSIISAMKAESNVAVSAMCQAMLEYGAAAQTFFGYNTESLASDVLDENATYLDAIRQQLSTYRTDESFVTGENPKLIRGSSMMLENSLSMRVYFKDSVKNVLVNGVETKLQASKTPGYLYCQFQITPEWFCDPITIEVKDGSTVLASATESVASYCARLYATGEASNAELADAILTYCLAANVLWDV